MSLFNNFPYSSQHELNLNWIIEQLKKVPNNIIKTVAGISADENGNVDLKPENIGASPDGSGAKFANSNITTRFLGTKFTEKQSMDIRSGQFKEVRVGGYWTINGRTYWAAHADYRLNKGYETIPEQHHMLVIPETSLTTAPINSEKDNSGGYIGSDLYKTTLNEVLTIIESDFGADHILPYSGQFTASISQNAVQMLWQSNRKLDLMNLNMVLGGFIRFPEVGIDGDQLALLACCPDLISKQDWYWLRDCNWNKGFMGFNFQGALSEDPGTVTHGIRPAFLIY